MRRTFITILVLAGVIGAGVLVGWWGTRERPSPARTDTPPSTPPIPATAPSIHTNQLALPAESTNRMPVVMPTNLSLANVPVKPGAEWEGKLDEILGSEDEDTNKVKQLFAMFPTLQEEGQEEVAQHLSNLVPDEDYSQLGKLLQDPKLSEAVLDVLMSDVLNRPNSVKLPLLLQVAQNPNHPKADEARDLMELYLDEEEPAKWPQKMQEWLKENPD